MTATVVGVDWGMLALGINNAPRKPRGTMVRSKGPMQSYGDHAAVSNVSVEVRGDDVFSTLGPNSAVINTTTRSVPSLVGSVDLFDLSAGRRTACSDRVVTIIDNPAFNADGPSHINLKSLIHLCPSTTTIRSDRAPVITSLIDCGDMHCIMSSDVQMDYSANRLSATGVT